MKFMDGVWVEMPPPLPPLPRKTKIKINWEIIAQSERIYAAVSFLSPRLDIQGLEL